MHTSIYIYILLLTKKYNVGANLYNDNVISGNEPSSEMLTSHSQKPE